jgi:hypothetical protein
MIYAVNESNVFRVVWVVSICNVMVMLKLKMANFPG